MTVKSKTKYNKKDRLRAELQTIIVNLMDNDRHKETVIKMSEQLKTRQRFLNLANSMRTSPDLVSSFRDKVLQNIRNT